MAPPRRSSLADITIDRAPGSRAYTDANANLGRQRARSLAPTAAPDRHGAVARAAADVRDRLLVLGDEHGPRVGNAALGRSAHAGGIDGAHGAARRPSGAARARTERPDLPTLPDAAPTGRGVTFGLWRERHLERRWHPRKIHGRGRDIAATRGLGAPTADARTSADSRGAIARRHRLCCPAEHSSLRAPDLARRRWSRVRAATVGHVVTGSRGVATCPVIASFRA
jgi:hypothetical protein